MKTGVLFWMFALAAMPVFAGPKAYEVAKKINFNNIFMGSGGRFYINEFGNLFKPVTQNSYIEYFYLGQLHVGGENCSNSDSWFPKPTCTES